MRAHIMERDIGRTDVCGVVPLANESRRKFYGYHCAAQSHDPPNLPSIPARQPPGLRMVAPQRAILHPPTLCCGALGVPRLRRSSCARLFQNPVLAPNRVGACTQAWFSPFRSRGELRSYSRDQGRGFSVL